MGCCLSCPGQGTDANGPSRYGTAIRELNPGARPRPGPEARHESPPPAASSLTTAAATPVQQLPAQHSSPPSSPRATYPKRATATITTLTTTVTASSSAEARRINVPLRRTEWTPRTARSLRKLLRTDAQGHRNRVRPTRAALARERADFFDTRVTGRPEVWDALRCVCALLRGEDQDAGADADADTDAGAAGERNLATAQGILDAAGITLPTGDLGAGGAYDEGGGMYVVPAWVVAEPGESVVRAAEMEEEGVDEEWRRGKQGVATHRDGDDDYDDSHDDDDYNDQDDNDEGELVKGKGKPTVRVHEYGLAHAHADTQTQVSGPRTVKLVARLSEGTRDVGVEVREAETVGSLARRVADQAGLSKTKKVRIAYMGRILDEAVPLTEQGWREGDVVSALVVGADGTVR